MSEPKWVFHGYMSFLTLTPTPWLLFSPPPPPPSPSSRRLFLLPLIKCQKKKSSTSNRVMSNLYTSLFPPCVSLYLPSILNQETVAWAKPGACQRITLPVCVPTSGLWFPAWLWLWSWPSMPYRSARRRKKRSSTHKLIPKAEGVISETDIKKAESLGSRPEWHLWKKKKNKKRRKRVENIEILQLWICCSFDVLLGTDQNCDEAHGVQRDPWQERPRRLFSGSDSLSPTKAQKKPGGLKPITSKTTAHFSQGEREWAT